MQTKEDRKKMIAEAEEASGRKWNEKAVRKLTGKFDAIMIIAYKKVQEAQLYAGSVYKPQPTDDEYFALAHMHLYFLKMASDLHKLQEAMLGKGGKE